MNLLSTFRRYNMNHPEYNQKAFLLPESILSCASYHAKILPTGEYMFRIPDCITGIRLRGDLNDQAQLKEAVEKLRTLADAAEKFAAFIEMNYKNK